MGATAKKEFHHEPDTRRATAVRESGTRRIIDYRYQRATMAATDHGAVLFIDCTPGPNLPLKMFRIV